MTGPEVEVATVADRAGVVGSLVAAFVADPVLRFLFPGDDTYPRHAGAFFGHLFDLRVPHGTVWTIGAGASVAMWDAPASGDGPPNDDAGVLDGLPPDAAARLREYDGAVHALLPSAPFWYLGVLGTHPEHAGRRWGRAVMRAGLQRAAAEGLPAVLETSNPGNVEVYRSAGWEVLRTVAGPVPVWVMQHPPPGAPDPH